MKILFIQVLSNLLSLLPSLVQTLSSHCSQVSLVYIPTLMSETVSHQYKTTGQIRVFYIITFLYYSMADKTTNGFGLNNSKKN
jgi:hypothetical protein